MDKNTLGGVAFDAKLHGIKFNHPARERSCDDLCTPGEFECTIEFDSPMPDATLFINDKIAGHLYDVRSDETRITFTYVPANPQETPVSELPRTGQKLPIDRI